MIAAKNQSRIQFTETRDVQVRSQRMDGKDECDVELGGGCVPCVLLLDWLTSGGLLDWARELAVRETKTSVMDWALR